jgi:subtilisin family serine protease
MLRIFPDGGKYEAKHRKYGLHLWYEITIPEDEDPEKAALSYGSDEYVQISEPRYAIRRMSLPALPEPSGTAPDDPFFGRQWNYNNTGQSGGVAGADIRFLDARKAIDTLGIANSNVIVAVMDGGVYYDHEDLQGNMWVNDAELQGLSGVDDDNNGYADDIHGYNFFYRSNGAIHPEDHATHVAGTIAAVTDNNIGVSGIAGPPGQNYGIKIMGTQIMEGDMSVSSIDNAFVYAADNGAVIAQNSWGYNNPDTYSEMDSLAISYFIREAGRDENGNPRPETPMVGGLVVFAAGNDKRDAKWYPAYFDNVLAVAATNHSGKLAYYSNYGNWIDVSAPGGEIFIVGRDTVKTGGIYSTSYYMNGKKPEPVLYEYMQGTSMACPHVSGVAALILSVYGNRSFTPDMLRARLLNTVTPLETFDPANASKMGAGLLNAAAAVAPGGIPGKITDLAGNARSHISAQLNWTVPPVQNSGTVTSFVAACSTEPITAANFDKYAGRSVRTSVKPGQEQQYLLSGLSPATPYYVAVRSIGNLGDQSEISNVIDFTTGINHTPENRGLPPDTTLIPYVPVYVDLSEYFTDPDGDTLKYTCTLSSTGIVNATVSENKLTIDPLNFGLAHMQITASDPFTSAVTASIDITVEQKYASDKAGKLLVYPNPTSNILYYSLVMDKTAPVSFRFVNTRGEAVYQTHPVLLTEGTYYYNINLSAWNSGVYIIQYMENGKTVDARKIIKQ